MSIVVLGGGESGTGAAVLAKVKGFDVFLSDAGKIQDKYKEILNKYEIEWEENGHSVNRILLAKEVIKSPGIPTKAPLIQQLIALGTPIISEIEFAGRYNTAKTVCITGSNGKTTTTMLTYNILKEAGLNGIEGYYPEYTAEHTSRYRALAEKLSLAISGGSDYHADMKPHIQIGVGKGDLIIPYYVLENLKNILKKENETV